LSVNDAEVAGAVRALTDRAHAIPPDVFLRARDLDGSGLYSWWADDAAREVIGEALGGGVGALIYVGQAGATKQRSGIGSDATLKSRIGQQHISGNARSSTFRLTISAVLLTALDLQVAKPSRLVESDNHRVSRWIADHLCVATFRFDDRDRLANLEERVLHEIDPPLNLQSMALTPARRRLKELRSRLSIAKRSVALDVREATAGAERTAHMEGQTQRVTEVDIEHGRIRIPSTGQTKALFPGRRGEVSISLRGLPMVVRWDPRLGPDRERSGVLGVGRGALRDRVRANEVLRVSRDGEVIHLD